MRVIGISGYARAGKDTIGSILVEEYGFERIAFADKMKAFALACNPIVGHNQMLTNEIVGGASINGFESNPEDRHLLVGDERTDTVDPLYLADVVNAVGWEVAKSNPEVRGFLQRLGTEAGRKIVGEDFWVDLALGSLQQDKNYVITDCRFPNEAISILALGGEVWRVNRPDVAPPNTHLSEVALDGFNFECVFTNNGTIEDLRQKVVARMEP